MQKAQFDRKSKRVRKQVQRRGKSRRLTLAERRYVAQDMSAITSSSSF